MAKSATRMRFEQAFKEARNSGDKTFEFEGKSYSTRMAGEGESPKKSIPLPPKRDVPRENDPEKSYPAEPMEASPKGYYNQKLDDAAAAGPAVTVNSEMPQKRYGTVRSGFYRAGENDVQGPDMPPTTGRLRTVGGNMAETNAGYPTDKSEDNSGYRKGGMVEKKSGGMMKKKSGGSVRGAGIAQRGKGKMRMC